MNNVYVYLFLLIATLIAIPTVNGVMGVEMVQVEEIGDGFVRGHVAIDEGATIPAKFKVPLDVSEQLRLIAKEGKMKSVILKCRLTTSGWEFKSLTTDPYSGYSLPHLPHRIMPEAGRSALARTGCWK